MLLTEVSVERDWKTIAPEPRLLLFTFLACPQMFGRNLCVQRMTSSMKSMQSKPEKTSHVQIMIKSSSHWSSRAAAALELLLLASSWRRSPTYASVGGPTPGGFDLHKELLFRFCFRRCLAGCLAGCLANAFGCPGGWEPIWGAPNSKVVGRSQRINFMDITSPRLSETGSGLTLELKIICQRVVRNIQKFYLVQNKH